MIQEQSQPAGETEIAFRLLYVIGAILAAAGAAIGFFLKRYWDKRDARQRVAPEAETRRLEREWQ
jgi:hypothetical protein